MAPNGQQPGTPPPASLRTIIMMGGMEWAVDEEYPDVVQAIEAFLLGSEECLHLTADRRPIGFARKLVQNWATAWPIKDRGRYRVVPSDEISAVFRR
jgi:hypothetical protein